MDLGESPTFRVTVFLVLGRSISFFKITSCKNQPENGLENINQGLAVLTYQARMCRTAQDPWQNCFPQRSGGWQAIHCTSNQICFPPRCLTIFLDKSTSDLKILVPLIADDKTVDMRMLETEGFLDLTYVLAINLRFLSQETLIGALHFLVTRIWGLLSLLGAVLLQSDGNNEGGKNPQLSH